MTTVLHTDQCICSKISNVNCLGSEKLATWVSGGNHIIHLKYPGDQNSSGRHQKGLLLTCTGMKGPSPSGKKAGHRIPKGPRQGGIFAAQGAEKSLGREPGDSTPRSLLDLNLQCILCKAGLAGVSAGQEEADMGRDGQWTRERPGPASTASSASSQETPEQLPAGLALGN